MLSLLIWLVLGFLAGYLAKIILPGADAGELRVEEGRVHVPRDTVGPDRVHPAGEAIGATADGVLADPASFP